MGTEKDVLAAESNGIISPLRAKLDLFLISVVLLFLEMTCIRWFPSHVLFLTFFTNTVLLACFLGMSLGCLLAERRTNFLLWTPVALVLAMTSAHGVESLRTSYVKFFDVGNQLAPQVVFFGTMPLEQGGGDPSRFILPIEVVSGFFFLIIALAMVGPGQELGRALRRVPNHVHAYTTNIVGSIAGIALFSTCAWFEMSPFWWFLLVVVGVGYFWWFPGSSRPFSRLLLGAASAVVLALAAFTSGDLHKERDMERFWSPYYRIDYGVESMHITVNLIGHQAMTARDDKKNPAYAYSLPHLIHRDAGGKPPKDVLIIGAGSGNDVSRALQWGAEHVDAVEIDPVIQRLGRRDHPDRPYDDSRVTVHLDDGRNFLRSSDKRYDLVIYALVDSLVLHSSYSNIRLESYLFTREAFADVRRHLKPDGRFVMYNYFRQGWIVARLHQGLKEVFEADPLVLTLPYQQTIQPEEWSEGFTVLMAGSVDHMRQAFDRKPEYFLRQVPPSPESPNGFEQKPKEGEKVGWERFGLATMILPNESLRTASDDWPFLYLRNPMIPDLSLRGMAIMGGIALLLLAPFLFLAPRPSRPSRPALARTVDVSLRETKPHAEREVYDPTPRSSLLTFDARMFFLGAGFMLVETKAVVHMALLFGSTWMVNSVVFVAVLIMILAANMFVLAVRPVTLWPYYVGLVASLALNALIPLDFFLGMSRTPQIVCSCLLVFAPILFAGVIFAVSFGRTTDADRAFGANVAGAVVGGLAEYSSMLLGFQYLVLVAIGFYLLSAMFGRALSGAHADSLGHGHQ